MGMRFVIFVEKGFFAFVAASAVPSGKVMGFLIGVTGD